jgi:predicted nucleic acid-binding protein
VIVLDASVLIAHLDATDSHHERADRLLAASGNEELAASVVTMAEVLVGPSRTGTVDRALAALEQLAVTPVPIERATPVRLALLRAETGLKLPDCCVLLAAEESGAAVATFDDRLAGAARSRGIRLFER